MPHITSPFTLLYCLLTAAVIYDLRERRVPQLINALLLGSGLGFQLLTRGPSGLIEGALGLLMALALLIVPFALYVYRGGDVKLCMGVGAWLGWEQALWFVAYGVLTGGVLGGLSLIARRLMSARSGAAYSSDQGTDRALDTAALSAPDQEGEDDPSTVPMALAFSLSALYCTLAPSAL
jgi:Flp pilus assembly protein protease CpaA